MTLGFINSSLTYILPLILKLSDSFPADRVSDSYDLFLFSESKNIQRCVCDVPVETDKCGQWLQ